MVIDEFETDSKGLADYLATFKRRKYQMLVPALATFVVIALVALLWPSTYRSSATILIESQDIPPDLVRSTVTNFAVQQIQETNQRATTVGNVMRLVDKYGLYEDKQLVRSEIVNTFRDNVNLNLISAEVIDPRSGRPTEATIAFSLSFDDRSPSIAQKITNELVNLYLDEHIKSRSEKSKGAANFLAAEAESLSEELGSLERQLSEFKKLNEGSLPELYQYNLSVVERTERDLLDVDARVRELEKNKIRLEAELSQLSPSAPVILATGEPVLSEADRLKALQSELREKSAIYSDNHPDVVRLKREVSALLASVGNQEGTEELAKALQTQRDKLAGYQSRYKPGHPDLLAQARLVADMEQQLVTAVADVVEAKPDNPAYVLLQSQVRSADTEIAELGNRKDELRKKLETFEGYILKGPDVERDYNALQRDYQAAQLKFAEIKAKQREAEVAKNLEQDRKGERFLLIDPPVLPEQPVSPNRTAILLLGVILSGAVGFGVVLLLEALDQSIRGEKALVAVTGAAPLVVVPYLEVSADQVKASQLKNRVVWSAGIGAILFIAFVHFFFKPLDVLWFVILRKLGL